MANLFTGTVKSNNKYVDLSVVSGVVFEDGKDYQIQFFNKGYIREGEEGKGFCIFNAEPFTIRYTGSPIYVCTTTSMEINVAE